MTNEERIARLENSFVILTELARSADEWRDTHRDWINRLAEAQANSDSKIAALTDAQIRTDERIAELSSTMTTLSSTMATLAERMSELADAQAHTDRRLDALIDIISQDRGKNDKL